MSERPYGFTASLATILAGTTALASSLNMLSLVRRRRLEREMLDESINKLSALNKNLDDLNDSRVLKLPLGYKILHRQIGFSAGINKNAEIVVVKAIRMFGSQERAAFWFSEPSVWLDGETPANLMRTKEGTRILDDYLNQIEHGIYS